MSAPVEMTLERFVRALHIIETISMQELVDGGVIREGGLSALGNLRARPLSWFTRSAPERVAALWAIIERRM